MRDAIALLTVSAHRGRRFSESAAIRLMRHRSRNILRESLTLGSVEGTTFNFFSCNAKQPL